jgi:hypothetical protein
MVPFIEDVLPWQAHGYATEEFEVTVERLGVYLPVSTHFFEDGFGGSLTFIII